MSEFEKHTKDQIAEALAELAEAFNFKGDIIEKETNIDPTRCKQILDLAQLCANHLWWEKPQEQKYESEEYESYQEASHGSFES
ncbi:MAG TPA: hypothetical protein VMV86_01995 [Methanosarcinales archaeon]|nr:hypothetical protein [Methanosarcinales archaeon]